MGVLLVSGLIEAIGDAVAVADVRSGRHRSPRRGAFLSYIVYFGRRAVQAGETGDIDDAPDVVPTR